MINVKTIRKPKSGKGSGGGTGTGFAAPSGGTSEYSDKAGYASQAGHAETAGRASRADVAEQVTDEVWQQIDRKDADTLTAAKNYADGNFLSKKYDDAAQGFIQFLAGISIGTAQDLWGYVRKVTENGVMKVTSWFKNLATDILTVTTCIKGNNGLLTVDDNLYGTGDFTADGDILAYGDIHSDTEVSAPKGTFDNVNVSDTITTKNLEVTGLAHFFELVIDKIRSAGGAQIYTPAEGFKVEAVNKFVYDGTKRCRLWWRATDGTVTTENMWEAGDQAICMNFNDIFNGAGQGVSNKYFWSVVAYKATVENGTPDWDSTNPAWSEGAENPYERTRWHYIDIFSGSTGEVPIDYLGSPAWEGAPWAVEAGDDVAMLGHRGNDVARQSALYLAAYKTIDKGYVVGGVTLKRALVPPHIAYYEGINDFNLGKHRTTFKDRLGGEWWGEMKVLVNGGYQSLDDYVASKLELTEEHFLTEISKLPISRNLLLNTDYTSIEAALPTYWDVWNAMHDFAVLPVTGEKWNAAYIRPYEQFNGIMQESKVLSGGAWKKVLKHGGTYTLSFWAKTEAADGTSRADILFHILKVYSDGNVSNPVGGSQPSKTIELTHDWQRAAVQFTVDVSGTDADLDGYAFRVMVGCFHVDVPSDERILVSRVQLEESVPKTNPQADDLTTATDWHRGEENAELMSSQIQQTADEISLAVKVDGVKRAGVTLDRNGVTIDGDKLHFNGTINDEVTIEGANLHILNDIDLQGLTTENVTAVERNPRYPTVINMGIGASNPGEVVKSVQVTGGVYDPYSNETTYPSHMVVLPFYDSIVGNQTTTNYWPTDQTEIDFDPDDNTFLLHDVASVPLSQRKVVQWTKNGTRLVIANEFVLKYRNWQNAGGDAGNLKGFVVVCADGRVVCEDNLTTTGPKRYNPSGSDGAGSAINQAGCFSCGGYIARFIVLLPGQSLQLRSQIIRVDGRDVLVWIVENPTEFVPYTWLEGGSGGWRQRCAEFNYDDQEDARALVYKSGYASFNAVGGYHGSYEAGIMVPAVMRLRSNDQDYTDPGISFTDLYMNN